MSFGHGLGHKAHRRRRRHHRSNFLGSLVQKHHAQVGVTGGQAKFKCATRGFGGGLVGADGAALTPEQRKAAKANGGEYVDTRQYTVKVTLITPAQMLAMVDTTGDGIVDTMTVDTTGDGDADVVVNPSTAQSVDTNGDGIADSVFIDVSGDGIADTMVAMQGGAAGTVQLRALSETELELTLATDKIDKLTFAAVIDALETWGDELAGSQGGAIGAHEADFEVSEISIGGFDTATRGALTVFQGEQGEEADAPFDKELDVATLLHPSAGNDSFSIKTTTTMLVLPAALAKTMKGYGGGSSVGPCLMCLMCMCCPCCYVCGCFGKPNALQQSGATTTSDSTVTTQPQFQ